MKKYLDHDNLPLNIVKKKLMKKYINQDDLPLNIVKRNLIRKQIVVESNKRNLKEKNRNFYIMNGVIFDFNTLSKQESVKFEKI